MSIPIRIEPVPIDFVDGYAEHKTENQAEREKINEIIEAVNYLLMQENMVPWRESKLKGNG